jgi:hypothetical protein
LDSPETPVLKIEISVEKFNQIRMGSTRAVAVLGFAYDNLKVIYGPIVLVTESGMSIEVSVDVTKYLRVRSLTSSDAKDVGYATLSGLLEAWMASVGAFNDDTCVTLIQFHRTDVEGG